MDRLAEVGWEVVVSLLAAGLTALVGWLVAQARVSAGARQERAARWRPRPWDWKGRP